MVEKNGEETPLLQNSRIGKSYGAAMRTVYYRHTNVHENVKNEIVKKYFDDFDREVIRNSQEATKIATKVTSMLSETNMNEEV